jgi:hypothetical protein
VRQGYYPREFEDAQGRICNVFLAPRAGSGTRSKGRVRFNSSTANNYPWQAHALFSNPLIVNHDDPDSAISSAHIEVFAWLSSQQQCSSDSHADLADAFARFVGDQTTLELRTTRNPSSCVYEARWYDAGRELEEFPKPFCAEAEADARLLACAALIHLDVD